MNVRIRLSLCVVAIAFLLTSVPLFGQAIQTFGSLNLDADSHFGRLSLGVDKKVPYYRTSALNKRNTKVTHALIVIHGASRLAGQTWEHAAVAAHHAGVLSRTLIIAPKFQIAEDDPKIDEPFWKGGWRGGDNSRDGNELSSFSVIDHIFHQLCDAQRFPNLHTIVMAGHSAGGQFTNRYAAAGEAFVRQGTSLRFVVMNPGTYLYLNKNRIGMDAVPYLPDASEYPDYNTYRYGLDDLNPYAGAVGVQGLRDTMVSRNVYYYCGQLDNQLDDGFTKKNFPLLQGINRYDCFLRYQIHVDLYGDPAWAYNTSFIPVPGIAHKEGKMMKSPQVLPALFL